MINDSLLQFALPAVQRKKLSAAFDGGRLSSDGEVLLLPEVEGKLGLAERLAACLIDRRDLARIWHAVVEIHWLRMFAIAVGYEDAHYCDILRHDPVFEIAVGRSPETGAALCSQPTLSRLENAHSGTSKNRTLGSAIGRFGTERRHRDGDRQR